MVNKTSLENLKVQLQLGPSSFLAELECSEESRQRFAVVVEQQTAELPWPASSTPNNELESVSSIPCKSLHARRGRSGADETIERLACTLLCQCWHPI